MAPVELDCTRILDAIPVGIWQQDWAPVYAELDALRTRGVDDFSTYFTDHPEAVSHVMSRATTTAVNTYCVRILHAHGQAEVPESFDQIVDEEFRPALAGQLAALAAGQTHAEFPVYMRAQDGSRAYVLIRVRVLADVLDENPAGARDCVPVFISLIDIARLEQLESLIQQRDDDLQLSTDERDQFVYAASHDLQEPLRMVASYAQLLAKRYGGHLDARADKYIGYIVDGAKRMQALIGGLLHLSRIGQPARDAVDMGEVVERAASSVKAVLEPRGGRISCGGLPRLHVDGPLLFQLFQQVFSNSIKFCDPDVSPHIQVSAERVGSEWVFAVADNGIGIETEHAHDIFVIFRRLHKRGTYPGIGIGLALVKKIIERHRGRVWLQGRPGQGTTLYFTLPVSQE